MAQRFAKVIYPTWQEAIRDLSLIINDMLRVHVYRGTGSPESVITAEVGSLYLREDGGTSTTLYVKESGSSNTGWVAK